jgi:hypothetical protein
MLTAFLALLFELAFYLFEGVLIAYFATNGMWGAMAAIILFVPTFYRDLSLKWTNFLYEVLRYMKGDEEMEKFVKDIEDQINNKYNKDK